MIPISFRQKRSPCRSVSDCSRLLNCLYRKQSEKCSAKCDRGFTSVCAVGRLMDKLNKMPNKKEVTRISKNQNQIEK